MVSTGFNIGKVDLHILYIFSDILDGLSQTGIRFHGSFNLAHGVNNGGMIPSSELIAYCRHAHLSDFLYNVHRNLAGAAYICGAFVALDILVGNVECPRNFAYYFADGNGERSVIIEDIPYGVLSNENIYLFVAVKFGVGLDILYRTSELSYILLRLLAMYSVTSGGICIWRSSALRWIIAILVS